NRREKKEEQCCLGHDTVSEYAKGELTEEEGEKVKAHIAGCSFCGRLAQATIRVLRTEGIRGERVSIIDRLRELLVQLKERSIQSLPPLIQTIFYPGREKIYLSDLFGVAPSSVSPVTLSSGETMSSAVKKVKALRLSEIGYSPEVEILLYKSDTSWVIRLDFTSLATPKPFSVILRGKGLHKKVVKVESNIARFEIPFQVPLKNIWIQI
ncbi:MAG: anti-sigma factor, partial [Candidatus Omnitrophota bacterium]|nr:anti-sigma factor [Candidatus Omnitrophota bacterium]